MFFKLLTYFIPSKYMTDRLMERYDVAVIITTTVNPIGRNRKEIAGDVHFKGTRAEIKKIVEALDSEMMMIELTQSAEDD